MKLNKYLKDRNLTNTKICEVADIGESTLSQFLNEKRGINFETACKLADAIGISLDKFRELVRKVET